MKTTTPQIDLLAAFQRAKANAWAKLNGGNRNAKLPSGAPEHDQFRSIEQRLHAGYLRVINNRLTSQIFAGSRPQV